MSTQHICSSIQSDINTFVTKFKTFDQKKLKKMCQYGCGSSKSNLCMNQQCQLPALHCLIYSCKGFAPHKKCHTKMNIEFMFQNLSDIEQRKILMLKQIWKNTQQFVNKLWKQVYIVGQNLLAQKILNLKCDKQFSIFCKGQQVNSLKGKDINELNQQFKLRQNQLIKQQEGYKLKIHNLFDNFIKQFKKKIYNFTKNRKASGLKEQSVTNLPQSQQYLVQADKLYLVQADKLYQSAAKLFDQKKYKEAIQEIKKSIKIIRFNSCKQSLQLAKYLCKIGQCHIKNEQYCEQGLTYLYQALSIRKQILNQHEQTSIALSLIGNMYHFNKEYDKSLNYRFKAYEMCSKLLGQTDHNTVTILSNIALTYQAKGDENKSIEYYKKVLEIREKTMPNQQITANVIFKLGVTYHKLMKFQEALNYYRRSKSIYALIKKNTNQVQKRIKQAQLKWSVYRFG